MRLEEEAVHVGQLNLGAGAGAGAAGTDTAYATEERRSVAGVKARGSNSADCRSLSDILVHAYIRKREADLVVVEENELAHAAARQHLSGDAEGRE